MTSLKMTLGLALLILSQTAVNAAPVLQGGVSLASRQNAGTGAGCDSIFTDTDTATGQGAKNAEDNTANLISGTKGSIPAKRQENKIADGAADILNAAGAKQVAGPVKTIGDTTDGDTTKDLANTGAEVGQLELDTIPTLGSAVP